MNFTHLTVSQWFGLIGVIGLSVPALSQPAILTQPQNQVVTKGSDVTFSVIVEGSPSSATLPAVTSGTLQLWLKADAGVVTNAAGQVSRWRDQSGNANDAIQTTANNQPLLAYPPAIGGEPAVRFNGIQDNVHGDYLQGTGDVGLANAMTAFTVYNAFVTTNTDNVPWAVGVPGDYGALRADDIPTGELRFSTWTYDYTFPWVVPTNTYRIWTDRVNTNLTTLEVFDASANSSTNFSAPMANAITPASGYYVGGLDGSLPYVVSSRCFNGDIAEMLFYKGYLSDADRLAVQAYLQQKYYLTNVTTGLSFQWQLDATNISGATNATLTLADVQTNEAGSYSVIVSNLAGAVPSSNAVLTVALPPAITAQPQSQEVVRGSNVTFSVSATGTAPLGFQWSLDGATVAGATNSALALTNVQSANAGTYTVTVSSPFGVAVSSNATLTVDLLPVIVIQPQSQTLSAGTNVTLSVNTGMSLPSVSSGRLQIWLKADGGVVTNASGQVSRWQDQSGNANDAVQATANNQPLLVYPPAIGGEAAVRFNGIQDGVNGDYLYGAGNVGLTNAMTAFTVYNTFTTGNYADVLWLVGVPASWGCDRLDNFLNGKLNFSTWSYDFSVPWTPPTNTYRIWTDRVNTNLTTLEIFDNTANSSTNFSGAMLYALTPSAGYYVGGAGESYNYSGDIAELVIYRGYLSDADRLAVAGYLEQKYFNGGSAMTLSFQWQFDNTNISGATNATLTLADIQTNDSGTYSVTVTDLAGSTVSSNAVLVVGNPPSVSVQPQSQEVVQGSNVTFTVSGSGTAPLSLQWFRNGAALAGATNSDLALTNVQSTNAGTYTVTVSSPFGAAVSSNATLTVDLLPVIVIQPQSQTLIVGTNVTLSVNTGMSLPSVSSGTLRLWLKADAGVVTNASGQVSRWQDQSGNTNDAVQANTNNQPLLVNPPAIGGEAAVRFNGIQDNVHGDYLHGTGDVGVSNAMTAFVLYNTFSLVGNADSVWYIGRPGVNGASRGYTIFQGLDFTTWGYDSHAYWTVPTNTYRICTDRVNTNLSTVEIFDASATSATNFSLAMTATMAPVAGYYVGGIDPSWAGSGYNLRGDIAELIYFKGYLNESDRLAVLGYLEQKYFVGNAESGFSFQWQFDSTNISGATNATLTLADVQTNDAGTYTVIVTDPAGSITSSNALLTVVIPPAITLQPQSQTVDAGGSVTFSAIATGTSPISYQWTFDATNVSGATNSSLTLLNLNTNAAGTYQVVATSPYGSAVSSNATLVVPITTVEVGGTSAAGGTSVTIPVELIALGSENALSFSLDFDPAVLTYSSAESGSGPSPVINSGTGSLGLLVGLQQGQTFSAGTQAVVMVTFQIAPVTNATTTTLTFGNLAVSDAQANLLPASSVPGVIVISPAALEGDVAPRPNGDEALLANDWVQEGRFVAGLDTISSPSEFQRADCAPRSTLGDGYLTVADWVQVGRYVVGLDPITAAGGPTGPPSTNLVSLASPVKSSLPDLVSIVPLSQGGANTTLAVQLAAKGTETALGFSLTFNPATVRFVGSSLGAGASNAYLIPNTNNAAAGVVGFLVGYQPPTVFAAGTQQILQLNFASVLYSNNVALGFGDAPIVRQVSDANANALSATFQGTTVVAGGAAWPVLTVQQGQNSLVLSWPASAVGFELETTPVLGGTWNPVAGAVVTNGDGVTLTVPISPAGGFFRLHSQ